MNFFFQKIWKDLFRLFGTIFLALLLFLVFFDLSTQLSWLIQHQIQGKLIWFWLITQQTKRLIPICCTSAGLSTWMYLKQNHLSLFLTASWGVSIWFWMRQFVMFFGVLGIGVISLSELTFLLKPSRLLRTKPELAFLKKIDNQQTISSSDLKWRRDGKHLFRLQTFPNQLYAEFALFVLDDSKDFGLTWSSKAYQEKGQLVIKDPKSLSLSSKALESSPSFQISYPVRQPVEDDFLPKRESVVGFFSLIQYQRQQGWSVRLIYQKLIFRFLIPFWMILTSLLVLFAFFSQKYRLAAIVSFFYSEDDER
jgi:hypothetical protein